MSSALLRPGRRYKRWSRNSLAQIVGGLWCHCPPRCELPLPGSSETGKTEALSTRRSWASSRPSRFDIASISLAILLSRPRCPHGRRGVAVHRANSRAVGERVADGEVLAMRTKAS